MLMGTSIGASAQVSLKTVVELAQRNSTGVRAAQADLSKANSVLSETKDAVIPSATVETGLPVSRSGFYWLSTVHLERHRSGAGL